jgi:DNA-binding NarL/FixJ family response regulator
MSRNGNHGTVRVLLVDDHPVVRRGLRDVLSTEPGLEVCGEAADPREAMELLSEVGCDLAIVDLSLQGPGGLELIRRLRSRYPTMAILVCSMHDEALFAERALRAGARGYVQKQAAAEQVLTAVRRILDGHFYLSSAMTDRLLGSATGTGTGTGTGTEEDPAFRLTGRELEVFELLGHARGTRQIAEQLHLSPKTVESHRENIKRKLDLANHNELMRSAVQWVLERDGSP